MTPQELKIRRVESFCVLAAKELSAAKMLSGEHREQSAYFLQQSVEKLARGLLEVSDVLVGTTHNIRQLAGMMVGHDALATRFIALDELSIAATRYRYPGPQGQLSDISEARLVRLMHEVELLNADVALVLEGFVRKERGQ